MAEPSTFTSWAESLEFLDYYEILRVDRGASQREIQEAFHAMSLRCHPDRFVDDGPLVIAAATRVFKRAVEAYGILRRPNLRARYDAELSRAETAASRGAVRIDEHAAPEQKRFEQRTLFMIARDPKAKKFAAQADAMLSVGNLEGARIQLISAVQHDPGNAELEERLEILYEALMLSPG